MINLNKITEYIDEIEKSNQIEINRLDTFIKQISELINENKENGKIYGIYKGQLLKIKKRLETKDKVINKIQDKYSEIDKKSQWVAIQNGYLKIGHKPGGKKRSFEQLINEGTTTVFTILSEREGALKIQRNCNFLGMDWIWLPLANGNIPNENLNIEIIEKLRIIKNKLQNQEKIYVHCSAGLHRTGMITNCILRFIGFDQTNSYEILKQLRPITAKEVGKKRLELGEQFYNVNT